MKKISKALFIAGIVLLVCALGLTVYNIADDYRAKNQSSEILSKMQIKEKSQNDSVIKEREMPEIEIDGRKYIGKIKIPAIDIELPVISSWDYDALRIAPCRYFGSVYTDNMVVAAHNYSSHFGKIGGLNIGDEIVFTDVEGNLFKYNVSEVETLGPYDIESMKTGGWDFTLFTCTLGGRTRVTVRCTKSQTNNNK